LWNAGRDTADTPLPTSCSHTLAADINSSRASVRHKHETMSSTDCRTTARVVRSG